MGAPLPCARASFAEKTAAQNKVLRQNRRNGVVPELKKLISRLIKLPVVVDE